MKDETNKALAVRIAGLTADHLPAVLRIERDSFKQPWSLESFRELITHGRTHWVSLVDSDVAGYMITQWVLDEIHILNVAVAERFRRRAVGSVMMEWLLNAAAERHMKSVYLEVRVDNLAAISFYRAFGFTELSVRKKYYEDGQDAVVMYCSLMGRGTARAARPQEEAGERRGH